MEAKQLEWFQKGNKLIVKFEHPNYPNLEFPVHKKLINYLAANMPPFVFMKVVINSDNSEHDFLLNFTGLKSLTSAQKSLKITIGAAEDDESKFQNLASGRYFFYRGDSYNDKFLTDAGWASSKKYFWMIDKEKLSREYQLNEPLKKETAPEKKFPTSQNTTPPPIEKDNTILEITI